jgi:hypothetical protein
VSPRLWSVSGIVTEYCGENYLLVTRAVMKPRRGPAPSPEAGTKPDGKQNETEP